MRLERRQALWLPILALHGLLLLALVPQPHARPSSAQGSLSVRLLPAPRATRPVAPPTRPAEPPKPAPHRPVPAPFTTPAVVPAGEPAAVPGSPPLTAQPSPDATAPPAPAPGSLLNTEATRRAIHLATRAPLLSERAASASEAPDRENAQQRFGREVARTAYGNCLKGEFPGAGGGLLSLPMFLIAEASGRCQK